MPGDTGRRAAEPTRRLNPAPAVLNKDLRQCLGALPPVGGRHVLEAAHWEEVSDEATFHERVLNAATAVIAAFETDSCGYCRQQRQLLSAAWRQLNWSAPTLRVDALRLPAVAAAHRIVAYPTIAVFLDGRVVERYPGRRDAVDVTRRLNALLGEPRVQTGMNGSRARRASAIPTSHSPFVTPPTRLSR